LQLYEPKNYECFIQMIFLPCKIPLHLSGTFIVSHLVSVESEYQTRYEFYKMHVQENLFQDFKSIVQ